MADTTLTTGYLQTAQDMIKYDCHKSQNKILSLKVKEQKSSFKNSFKTMSGVFVIALTII